MLRSSSTWHSSWRSSAAGSPLLWLPLIFMLVAFPAAGKMCLPSLFEDGRRLHGLNGPSLFDLSLTLRQHEICHRPKLQPEEGKILLFGNSSVFGLHVPAGRSFAGLLNQGWDAQNASLHIYNLAHVFPYQLKDALILREALEYQPGLIVFGVALIDFVHMAPLEWPEALTQFFVANDTGVDRLADEGAAGLDELVEIYRKRSSHRSRLGQQWERLRESGSYLRLAARHRAPALVNRWLLAPEDGPVPLPARSKKRLIQAGPRYECRKVTDNFEEYFGSEWPTWNVLAYLEQVKRERGVDVVVFSVPIQHNPSGGCYNRRNTTRADSLFRNWVRREANSRDLEFWDLHDLLPKPLFADSIHPTEVGHERIAEVLGRRIKAYLRAQPPGRSRESVSGGPESR